MHPDPVQGAGAPVAEAGKGGLISGITQHSKRVRFYSTVDLVNLLEQEKAAGRAGRLAFGLMRMDLIILDELTYTSHVRTAFATSVQLTVRRISRIVRELIAGESARFYVEVPEDYQEKWTTQI